MSAEPYGDWRDSLVAPFIQKILEEPATRDATRLVLADWLEDFGGKVGETYARDLRDPAGRWDESDKYPGMVSWHVDPWHEHRRGIGGISVRIDKGWELDFPTEEYMKSPQCRALVAAWILNGVATYQDLRPWVEWVVDSLPESLRKKYREDMAYKEATRIWHEKVKAEQEAKDWSEYRRLKAKYEPK